MQVLTQVTRYTTKKDGTPLMSAKGKPYTSLRIKTQEYGDKILSGFDNSDTADWKVGDEVDIIVEQKGEYLNFTLPKIQKVSTNNAELMHAMQQLMTSMGNMNQKLDHITTCLNFDKRLSTGDYEPKF